MIELDARQAAIAMFFLVMAIFFIGRYFMITLKARRFNKVADIVSSSNFDNLSDIQKSVFLKHIKEQGDQLKYDSSTYKIQRFVYGSISLFFIVSALIMAIKIFLAALAYFNNELPVVGAIDQAPIAFVWFFGAVVFSILRANAMKNLDIAIMLEKGGLKID